MREILFKAKRKDNGEWIEGYYYKRIQGSKVVDAIEKYNGNIGSIEYYEIDPETICQFTGLRDKNGNKIYEKDIVKCCSVTVNNVEGEFVSDVFWHDCMWMLHEGEYCDSMLCYFDMSCEWGSHVPEIEVIGNVFDNPELLSK